MDCGKLISMVNGIDSSMMTNVVKASQQGDDVIRVFGGKPLEGSIRVRGAKNFVSKAMVAALLAPGTSVLKNVPEIRDVQVVSDLLRLHGVNVNVDGS
jgi:UDP-N-acetylglucosamine 1-carboxyvinyltransferase